MRDDGLVAGVLLLDGPRQASLEGGSLLSEGDGFGLHVDQHYDAPGAISKSQSGVYNRLQLRFYPIFYPIYRHSPRCTRLNDLGRWPDELDFWLGRRVIEHTASKQVLGHRR